VLAAVLELILLAQVVKMAVLGVVLEGLVEPRLVMETLHQLARPKAITGEPLQTLAAGAVEPVLLVKTHKPFQREAQEARVLRQALQDHL